MRIFILKLITIFSCIAPSFSACSSCLLGSSVAVIGSQRLHRHSHKHIHVPPSPRSHYHHHYGPWRSTLAPILINQLSTHFGTTILTHALSGNKNGYNYSNLRTQEKKGRTPDEEDDEKFKENESESEPPISAAMVATIGIYKNWISPLLPPACRFQPTCSQYGVKAIEEFGPQKGIILTAWRLLRCSPFGGRGYDPPKWPPVPYTYASY